MPENERKKQEFEAQGEKIVEEFNRKMIATLQTGSPIEVLQIMSAFNLYVNTVRSTEK
jgi:hypothetical protein